MSQSSGLSKHDETLLSKAVQFMAVQISETGKVPTRDDLRLFLNTGASNAQRLREHIINNNLVSAPAEPELKEKNVISEDTWEISLPKTHIKTLPELIAECKVDTAVWEVKTWECTKWEMGFVAKGTKLEYPADKKKGNVKKTEQHNTSGTQDLWRVKAVFIRKQFSTLTEYAKDNARLRSQVEKLRLRVSSEHELATRLARNHAGYDDVIANIKEFVNVIGDLSLPYEKISTTPPLIVPAVSQGHSEDAVLLLSDTHFGDQIRREDTSGFPEYDLVIGGNRMGYVIQKAKQVLTLHRSMYPLRRLYVWIGGDIGNGELHELRDSNELFLPAQVHFSYHMLKFGIEDLLTLTVPDEKGNRVVEEIVLLFTIGNHMRLDEKMPNKIQAQRTLDWLIYQFLIEKFTGVPNVTIRSDMSPFIFENIRGHRHLFAHGLQVGYRNSPDAQNKAISSFIDRARALFDSPEWRRKNGLEGATFDRVCIGDIHVPIDFPRFKSNGSLNGQNELGVNWTLEPIPAGQQLFGVSDKHQETWAYFLECTHVQRDFNDFNNYGMFAAEYAKRIGR